MRGPMVSGMVPPNSSAVPVASDGQVGAVLLDALLNILLHALREAVERDEAADRDRHAGRGEDRARRSALQIAERELEMVHLAAFRNLARRPFRQATILDADLPRASGGEVCVVRDEDEGHAARLMQVEEQVDDLLFH